MTPRAPKPFTTAGAAARRVLRGLTQPGGEPNGQAQEPSRVRGDEPGEAAGDRRARGSGCSERSAIILEGPGFGRVRREQGRRGVEGRRPAESVRLIHGRSVEWWAWQATALVVLLVAFAIMLGVAP